MAESRCGHKSAIRSTTPSCTPSMVWCPALILLGMLTGIGWSRVWIAAGRFAVVHRAGSSLEP